MIKLFAYRLAPHSRRARAILIALGLVIFGIYSLAEARWRRV